MARMNFAVGSPLIRPIPDPGAGDVVFLQALRYLDVQESGTLTIETSNGEQATYTFFDSDAVGEQSYYPYRLEAMISRIIYTGGTPTTIPFTSLVGYV